MGQQLSVASLQDHISSDFHGCFYHASFGGCTPLGNYATCAISRRGGQSVLVFAHPPTELCSGTVVTDNVDDLNSKQCVVRAVLKKNVVDTDTLVPILFPSVSLSRLPVTIHHYLAELSGVPILERTPRPSSPGVDETRTPGCSPALGASSPPTFIINKEFILRFLAKLQTQSFAPTPTTKSHSPPPPPLVPTLHPNIVPILRIDETDKAFYIVCEKQPYTLDSMIQFSPHLLEINHMLKPFLMYQFLQALAHCHQQGVIHGNLKPQSLLLSKHNWLYLTGFQCPGSLSHTDLDAPTPTLEDLQRSWMNGGISNFGYLMALNRFARRRIGDPYFHPVMPWVTDFSVEMGGWRDLEKTKFRLTKGEEQMELMNAAGHHITDVLTELAYFSYLSRRAPIHSLTHYVRSTYVPNEYPSSVERMYKWTPDESIPEFYTDPTIFKSTNPDMPDLTIPDWATSPEDFIQKHMAALESDYVSANLHHWIDLTFGYQLSGEAAAEAKNIIHVDHSSPRTHGLLQLFSRPHPRRLKPVVHLPSLRFSSSSLKDSPTEAAANQGAAVDHRKQRRSRKESPYNEKYFSRVLSSQIQSLFEQKTRADSVTLKDSDTELYEIAPASPPSHSTLSGYEPRTSPTPFAYTPSVFQSREFQEQANEFYLIESLLNCENTTSFEIFADPVYKPALLNASLSLHNTDISTKLQAQDIFAAGCIFAELYQTRPLFSHQTLLSYSKGTAPPPTQNLPLNLRSIVERMVAKNPLDRPSARQVLEENFFPPYFGLLHNFLATFQALPTWAYRLDHCQDHISMILDLPEECFLLVIPHACELLLCGNAEVQVRAVVDLLDPFAARLGPTRAKLHLLQALQALYEVDDIAVQTHLVQIPIVDMVITRFGRPVFIDEVLPHLLNSAKKRDYPLHDLLSATLTKMTNILGISLSIKHIVYPLLACLAKPNSQHIADTLVAMAEMMGESVVVTHYLPYLFSLLQKHLVKNSRVGKGETVPVIVLSMINELVGCMRRTTVLRALVVESTALVLILLNPPNAPVLKALTQPLVRIAAAIGPHNTIKYMLRYLQQFFSNYGEFYVEGHIDILTKPKPDLTESDDFLRHIYAPEFTYSLYYQFWKIVGRDVMRREISNSTLIEQILMAYVRSTHVILDFSEVTITDAEHYDLASEKKDDDGMYNNFSAKLARTPSWLPDDHNPDGPNYDQFSLSWEVVVPLKDHNHSVRNIAVHPCESLILSSARDGVKCWSLSNSRPLMTYTEHTHNVSTVHFLNNSLAASCDGSIYVWDYERRTTTVRFQEGDTNYLTFIPFSDRILLAATSEASISVLDVASGQVVAEWMVPFQHHSGSWGTGNIRALALSTQSTCPNFDPPSPFSSLSLSSHLTSTTASGAASHASSMPWDCSGGSWLAVGSTAGAISLLDARTGVLFDTWKAHDGQILKLLPMGKHFLLSASSDKTVVLWDLRPSPPQIHYTLKGHADPVGAMCLIGTDIISAAGHKLSAEPLARDDVAGSVLKIETYRLQQNKSNITALEVLPYHQLLVAGMEDGHVKLFR